MKKGFYFRAWHFCVLFVALFALTYIIGGIDLKAPSIHSMAELIELDEDTFPDRIASNTCFVLFHDGESPVNTKMSSNLSRFANECGSKADFYKVNIDECENLGRTFGISGVPSVLILKEGQEMNRIIGIVPVSNLKRVYDKIN